MARFSSTARSLVSVRLLIIALIACTAAHSGGAGARPGTPNDTVVRAPYEKVVELLFTNTASEQVTFDIELTKLSAPSAHYNDPNAQPLDARTHFNCTGVSNPTMAFQCTQIVKWQQGFQQIGAQLTVFGNSFVANSRYCARIRAREWNGGNPQAGHVSDKWSAWKCATTPKAKAGFDKPFVKQGHRPQF